MSDELLPQFLQLMREKYPELDDADQRRLAELESDRAERDARWRSAMQAAEETARVAALTYEGEVAAEKDFARKLRQPGWKPPPFAGDKLGEDDLGEGSASPPSSAEEGAKKRSYIRKESGLHRFSADDGNCVAVLRVLDALVAVSVDGYVSMRSFYGALREHFAWPRGESAPSDRAVSYMLSGLRARGLLARIGVSGRRERPILFYPTEKGRVFLAARTAQTAPVAAPATAPVAAAVVKEDS